MNQEEILSCELKGKNGQSDLGTNRSRLCLEFALSMQRSFLSVII